MDSQPVIADNSGDDSSAKPVIENHDNQPPVSGESDATAGDDDNDDDNDLSDMPPLEEIAGELGADAGDQSYKSKNIVIPDDKTDQKPVDEDGWLDILDNGDLRKRVLTPGLAGQPRPERGCVAVIKVVTKLLDTQTVVESETYDSIDVVVGDADLIQGIDLAVPLMEQREVARVVIKSRFAFGRLGREPDVPPDATLDCEIHLLSVEWGVEEIMLPIGERTRIGNRKKERGNFWYGRADYSTAIQCYKSAIKYLDAKEAELDGEDNEMRKHFDSQMKGKTSGGDDESSKTDPKLVDELVDIRCTAYNNLAAAQLKVEAMDGALNSVNAVLDLQPNNVKALFRKGKILSDKGELDESIELLRRALAIDSESKIIGQELARLVAKRKQELKIERDLYKRMLSLDTSDDTGKGNHSTVVTAVGNAWLKWGLIGGLAAAVASVMVAYKFVQ